MQPTATFFEVQPQPFRDTVLYRLRAVGCLVAGAVSASALAQVPANSTAAEQAQAASETRRAAESDSASHSEPDVAAPWNRRPSAPAGVDGQLRRLTADLKLDPAQQAKVRQILVERSEQMQRLQHDTRVTAAERRVRALAIGDRSAAQIRAQLTDAQRAQYIQPRAATAVTQAAAAGRHRGTGAPATTVPGKGAEQ